MGNSSHLKALIKKNLLVYKSTFILTIIELVFPMLVIFLFWKLRTLFEITNTQIKDDIEYYYNESLSFSDKIYFNRYHIFSYCSITHKFIAIIGDDFPIQYFNRLNITFFINYSSIKELNEYIESPQYGTDWRKNPEICFGITYSLKENKYKFKLHFFASLYYYHYPQIPSTALNFLEQFATQPDFSSYYKYAYQGFLEVLKSLYDIILKKETKNIFASISFTVMPQKFDKLTEDSFRYFLKFILGFFVVIAYALPLSINIYRLVKEKESRAKEGMKIMGLKESTYFLSYFIIYLIVNLIYSFCNSILLNKGMTYIEIIYLFIFFYLYGLVIYSLIFFFQSFLEKTRLAIIVSLLIYCLMYFFSFCVNSNVPSRLTKFILCIIFPPITMQLGLNTFTIFETNFNQFKGRVFLRYYKFSIFDMYILFLANFLLYMFLGFYIQNIISHEFGIKKNWYFLFTKSYWGCRKEKQKVYKVLKNNFISNKIELNILKDSKTDININNKNIINDSKSDIFSNISKKIINPNLKDIDKTGLNLLDNSKINIIRASILNDKENKTEINNINQKKKINDENIDINSFIYNEQNFFENNDIYKENNNLEDSLQIKDIHKIFGDKKVALNGVTFNLYRNEIFALLGHNGAGKSTLINILTGLYPCTSGSAFYNSYNILTPEGLEQFRKVLGICPQHDVLFNELTVEEHLEMFCVFKSIDSSLIEKEISKVINDFGLQEKRYTKVKNLSGGQKRKLSIAIALVGGSSVIFLDEPTSGMDITARRNLWNVLKRCLNGKIIILTTHYMEEASVLGNRIGILSEGNMKCIGSPLFLIENFGKNININITKKTEANNNEIISFIKNYYGQDLNIQFEIFNEEILFKIPKENNNFKGKEFFNLLDQKLQELNIKSYSISMSTLEDVFINISEIVKRKKMTKEEFEKEEIEKKKKYEDNNKILYDDNNYQKMNYFCLKILRDTKISVIKRIIQIYRDKKTFFLEIFCPILLVLIGCIVGSIDILEKNISVPLHINQITNDSQIIYYSSEINEMRNIIKEEIFSKYSSEDVSKIEFENINLENSYYNYDYNESEEIYFMQQLYNKNSNQKKIKKNYVGYFFSDIDNFYNNYRFTYFPNIVSRQSTAIYLNYLLNNLVRYATKNENLEIEIINEPLPYTREEKMDKQERNRIIILFFISISFSLIPANFITIIIKERENNSKHLQIISGISLFSYWLNNYIFELIKYYIIGGICILIIYVYDYYNYYLLILYLEYGPAMVSFTYLFSFIFKSEDKGQTCVLLVNLLVGTLGGSAVLIMRLNIDLKFKARIMAYILKIIPSFSFCYGYNVILNKDQFWEENEVILRYEFLKSDFIYLGVESVLYLLILIFLENANILFRTCYTTSKKENKNKINIEVIKDVSPLADVEDA